MQFFLFFVLFSGSVRSRTSPGPQQSASDRRNSRKQSLTEKVVAAFSAAGASKDEKPHPNPVKRRWQRSVKRVMLQNAVNQVKNLLFSKDDDEAPARPSSSARESYKASSPSSPAERSGVSPVSPAVGSSGSSSRNARATFPGPSDAPEFVSRHDNGSAPLKPKAAFGADFKN
jgi:hypothetical protein